MLAPDEIPDSSKLDPSGFPRSGQWKVTGTFYSEFSGNTSYSRLSFDGAFVAFSDVGDGTRLIRYDAGKGRSGVMAFTTGWEGDFFVGEIEGFWPEPADEDEDEDEDWDIAQRDYLYLGRGVQISVDDDGGLSNQDGRRVADSSAAEEFAFTILKRIAADTGCVYEIEGDR